MANQSLSPLRLFLPPQPVIIDRRSRPVTEKSKIKRPTQRGMKRRALKKRTIPIMTISFSRRACFERISGGKEGDKEGGEEGGVERYEG